MFNAFDASNLGIEIAASEHDAEKRLRSMRRLTKRYSGSEITSDKDITTDLENHAYEFISLVGPQIMFENPRMVAKPRRLEIWDFAQSLQLEMNQWIRDSDVRKQFIMSMVDDAFLASPLYTVPRPAAGFDPSEPDVPFEPRIYRLSPEQFGYDSRVSYFEQARFAYHSTIRDKTDLLSDAVNKDEGWIASAIGALSPREFHTRAWNPMLANSGGHVLTTPAVKRDEIRYYEVWVPEIELKEARELGGRHAGFHGTIFTIVCGHDHAGTFIREPYPYFGPSWGPYSYEPWYIVPDDAFGMSPLAATQVQSYQHNQMAQVLSSAIRNYKRLLMVSSDDDDLAEKIQNKPHDFVIPVDQFQAKASAEAVEIGGVTEQMMAMDSILKDRLDRNSGISETRRGNITKASATEIEEAGAAGDTRTAWMKIQFMAKCRKAIKTAAWYFAYDPRVLRNSGFAGDQLPEGMSLEHMDIDIDVTSFGRTSQRQMQQNAMLELQIAEKLAVLGSTVVGIDVETAAETLAVDLNMPNLPKIFDAQALQAQAMLAAVSSATGGGGGGSAPPQGSRAGGPSKGNDKRAGFSRGASAAAAAKR